MTLRQFGAAAAVAVTLAFGRQSDAHDVARTKALGKRRLRPLVVAMLGGHVDDARTVAHEYSQLDLTRIGRVFVDFLHDAVDLVVVGHRFLALGD